MQLQFFEVIESQVPWWVQQEAQVRERRPPRKQKTHLQASHFHLHDARTQNPRSEHKNTQTPRTMHTSNPSTNAVILGNHLEKPNNEHNKPDPSNWNHNPSCGNQPPSREQNATQSHKKQLKNISGPHQDLHVAEHSRRSRTHGLQQNPSRLPQQRKTPLTAKDNPPPMYHKDRRTSVP